MGNGKWEMGTVAAAHWPFVKALKTEIVEMIAISVILLRAGVI